MKKTLIALAAFAVLATSCENKKQKQALEDAQALAAATTEELVQAVQERDELIDIVNEITQTTEQIKDMEKVVSINTNGVEGGNNYQVIANIDAIKATLKQRRERLEELEAALKNSKTANSKLLATIETLKNQISSQSAEIESLTAKLNEANERIANLGGQVDSLATTVNTVTEQRDSVANVAKEQEALANACYYAIGSKDELKANGIIEGGGFLRKDKINSTNLNKAYFTKADRRSLSTIPLHSKKAKVITNFQPKDSYEIIDGDGQKILRILNPTAFWSLSDYLVIQID